MVSQSLTDKELEAALHEVAAEQAAWLKSRQAQQPSTKQNDHGILFLKLRGIGEYLKASELVAYKAAAPAEAIKHTRACFMRARLTH